MTELTALAELAARVVDRTVEVAAVAGPPLDEADRASVVRAWWEADGLAGITQDATGNCWACVRDGAGPATVVAAHLDTVFGRDEPHGVRRDGDHLRGPGVGDDSIALAALSALDILLPEPMSRPVWILATVGEEGLGDLAGVRGALDAPVVPVAALIALEGNYLDRIGNVAVGSERRRVSVRGAGGHAWEARRQPSAVHAVARAVAALTRPTDSLPGTTAINVGFVDGGEAINARARQASFTVDLRADGDRGLAELLARLDAVLADVEGEGFTLVVEPCGSRPAGRMPDDHPLVLAAVAALTDAGRTPRLIASSTDANAAMSRGIPAIAVGITEGAGEHTHEEWIRVSPVATGLLVLADTIVRWQRTQEGA